LTLCRAQDVWLGSAHPQAVGTIQPVNIVYFLLPLVYFLLPHGSGNSNAYESGYFLAKVVCQPLTNSRFAVNVEVVTGCT